MKELVFNRSVSPTIGVEIEVQILDAATLQLASLAPEILKRVRPPQKGLIKAECIRSMVEINTKTCSSLSEVEENLRDSYKHLEEIVKYLGATIYVASLHPYSKSSDQLVSDNPRYIRLLNEQQIVGRRFITQGLHVHIGVDDKERVIKVNNNMRIYLPILLALSTSSPYFESEDTGLMSYRIKLFESLPLAGMPDSLGGWEEFNTLIKLLSESGVIETARDIWWDVRPHPDFGTVEIRVCDIPYSLRDILALTALIQALVITILEQHENPLPHIQILRSNKWQAARYGLDGFFVDPFFGRRCSMKEAATDLYRFVRPVAERLKSLDYLNEVPEIIKRGTGADLQRRFYSENGGDFIKMIRKMQKLFMQ
jgi:carboxylate-amine ligase